MNSVERKCVEKEMRNIGNDHFAGCTGGLLLPRASSGDVKAANRPIKYVTSSTHQRRRDNSLLVKQGHAEKRGDGRQNNVVPTDTALRQRRFRRIAADRAVLDALLWTNPGCESIIARGLETREHSALLPHNPIVQILAHAMRKLPVLANDKKHKKWKAPTDQSAEGAVIGGAIRGRIFAILCGDLSARNLSSALNGVVSPEYIRKQKQLLRQQKGFLTILSARSPLVAKVFVGNVEAQLYVDFMMRHSVIFSGSDRLTRHLTYSLFQFEILLFASFPSMLRLGLSERQSVGINSFGPVPYPHLTLPPTYPV